MLLHVLSNLDNSGSTTKLHVSGCRPGGRRSTGEGEGGAYNQAKTVCSQEHMSACPYVSHTFNIGSIVMILYELLPKAQPALTCSALVGKSAGKSLL